MNFLKKVVIALAVIGFSINSVSAQTAAWNNVTITVGTASASVELSFDTQGTTVLGYGINTTYDNASMVWTSCASAATVCNDNAGGNSGTVNIGAIAGPGANPLATLVFDTSATPVGVYNIVSPSATWVDSAITDQPLPVTAGTITVVAGPQPVYNSAPIGGSTLALNGSIGTNPTSDVVITNAGTVGAPNLTGTCALSGADAASFSIVTPPAINIAQGADQTMTVDCDATAATMAQLNASLDCTHNGDATGEPSPVSYPLTCDIAAISPQYNSTPAGGSAIAMGSILQGGTNPTASIDIDNDAGDATTTLSGTCTAPVPFIVTNGAFSVLQGAAAATVDIACDATVAPAAYAEDLTCTHNGTNVASPVTYPMTCEVLAAAATGNQNPAPGSTLNIVVPPSGSGSTSIVFSEVGGQGVDITDLSCTIAPGVGFAITSPGAFPATVPAGGSLPVVVTFTDPGDGSATPGTLDCTYTDGTGTVDASYELNFAIQAINVPTLSMMGYLVLTLGFGLIGFFAFRRRA